MSNKMKWIIGGVLAFVLVLGCCLYFIPKTTPFDITLNATKTGDRNGEKNDMGTEQIHVHGTLKEYLFRPSELTLEIDDFDIFHNILSYTKRGPDRDADVTVELTEGNHTINAYGKEVDYTAFFIANSTVTGDESAIIHVHFSSDLKNWVIIAVPDVLIDEAFEDDPSFDCVYTATVD